MSQILSIRSKRSLIVAATLAVAAGALFSFSVRAADSKADAGTASMLSADDHKLMMAEVEKIRAMAADPKQAEKLKIHMAKMMTMDNMAKQMALDPTCKEGCLNVMSDPQVKKLHDEAEAMLQNPAEMEKLQKEVMADPVLVKVVTHRALTMAVVVASGGHLEDMNGTFKSATDKLKEMGGAMLNKK